MKLLPFFRRMEADLDIRDDFHGNDGPMRVRRHKEEAWEPLMFAFRDACVSEGYPDGQDMNNPDSTGVAPLPMNNVGGVRLSTALSYINPVRHRLNLTIRPNALTTRVLFEGNRAVGVQVESGGETFTVEGDLIVLSTGSIASPHLLMVSGVGPRDHLSSTGVPVVRDLPGVGQNYRDHPQVGVTFSAQDDFSVNLDAASTQLGLRYTATGSDLRNDMVLFPTTFSTPMGDLTGPGEDFRMSVLLNLAKGSGQVTLASSDPHEQPLLEYHFLEEQADVDRLRDGIRLIIRLSESEYYRGIVKERLDPTDADLETDETLDAWLHRMVPNVPALGRHLQDGPGVRYDGRGRPVRQGTRDRRPAGSRRLRHARCPPRQHQREHHHDRRADIRVYKRRQIAVSAQIRRHDISHPGVWRDVDSGFRRNDGRDAGIYATLACRH